MSSSHRQNAVIIDDQHLMRKAIRRTLERDFNFAYEEFSNGKEAIAYLKKTPVDLVISDIYMPNGDGFEVVRFLRGRALANDVPIIFVTGEATKDDIVKAVDLGVNDYVLKPFDVSDLTLKIKSVIDKFNNPTEEIRKIREAEAALIEGNLLEAQPILELLRKQSPKWPRVLIALAEIYLQKKMSDKSLELINSSIDANPMYFQAYSLGAQVSVELSDSRAAISFLERELKIHGKQPEKRTLLANLYLETGDSQKATEQLRLALVESPKDEDLLLRMAELLFKAGDHEKAIHYFLKTRRAHPSSGNALAGVATVCFHINKPIRAIHTFTDLLKLNPMQRDILMYRARVHEKMGELGLAMDDLNKFIEHNATSLEAWQAVVRILTKQEKSGELIEALKKICKIAPTGDNFARVALLLLKSSDHKGAAEYYEQAVALVQDNPKYYFNLGYAHETLGNYVQAIRAFERFLTLVPNHAEAVQAIARLRGGLQRVG